ncbi:MAG TPA: site-specific integrase [Thermomicrobiaceae bacterium]|nr:site-specific integrase [Thermomicrobiaceae bacterium]
MPLSDAVRDEDAARDSAGRPVQPALFDFDREGRLRGHVAIMPELTADSSLDVARYWYRRYLEQSGHPANTVKSYSYDLAVFEQVIGPRPVGQIRPRDVGHFLDESNNRSTRKRRLTSISGLFKFLINRARVLDKDPSESFYPEHIPLKTPRPLFAEEQERLLAAATEDGVRAQLAVWLMLRLGLSRAEVLQLRAEHLDFSDPEHPVVYVFYDDVRHRGRERKLAGDASLATIYRDFRGVYPDAERLFPIFPQSLNKLVERVATATGLTKHVSPQSLRDTFAVDRACEGADEADLLRLLGLADDARNRMSVRRYLKLAEPPLLGTPAEAEGATG